MKIAFFIILSALTEKNDESSEAKLVCSRKKPYEF